MSIIELSSLFSDYKIYPQDDYTSKKSFKLYENEFPNDPYVKDVNFILSSQDKKSEFCADLPWWGANYFDQSTGKRIMAISQDTNAPEAGSIALHSHLMGKNSLGLEIENDKWKNMKFFKEFFDKFLNDYNYLYVTDARKVRKKNKGPFNNEESMVLLQKEIRICNPDLIIVFGTGTANRLGLKYSASRKIKIKDIQNFRNPIAYNGRKYIISPFLTGQGRFGKGRTIEDFENGKNKAIELIKSILTE